MGALQGWKRRLPRVSRNRPVRARQRSRTRHEGQHSASSGIGAADRPRSSRSQTRKSLSGSRQSCRIGCPSRSSRRRASRGPSGSTSQISFARACASRGAGSRIRRASSSRRNRHTTGPRAIRVDADRRRPAEAATSARSSLASAVSASSSNTGQRFPVRAAGATAHPCRLPHLCAHPNWATLDGSQQKVRKALEASRANAERDIASPKRSIGAGGAGALAGRWDEKGLGRADSQRGGLPLEVPRGVTPKAGFPGPSDAAATGPGHPARITG